jgi:iron complex outermembrane receptor protein
LLLRFGVFLATAGSALVGFAQEPSGEPSGEPAGIEAPSDLQRQIEGPQPLEGEGGPMDAEAAEAEKARRASPAAADLTRKRAEQVEEIVVHARRREELLEDTPVAVTVLSDELLQAANVTRLDEIQNLVPNLTIFRTLTGQTASVVLRGVGNFPFVYFDQGVGIYVDGVFLSRNNGSVLDVIDTQQIEVLRGPQGTLFGKNTVGGAIVITTVQPKEDLEASAWMQAGSFDTFNSRAMLNVPIKLGYFEDKLFARVNFASYYNGGYTYNSLRHEYDSNRNSLNFLGSLRYVPTDDVTFTLTGTWSDSHTRAQGGQCVYVEDPPGLAALPAAFPPGFSEQYKSACQASRPFVFQSELQTIAAIESSGVWGILDWQVGDAAFFENVDVRLTSAWRQQEPRARTDLDMTEFPVSVTSSAGGGIDYGGQKFDGAPSFQRQIQAEGLVNANALDGRLAFVTGVFSFWEEADENMGLRFFANAVPGALGDIIRAAGFSQNFVQTDNWDWAIYTQETYNLTDWAAITAGVRYTEEKKGLIRKLIEPFAPPGGQVPVDFDKSAIFTDWTPMASLALTAPDAWIEPIYLDHLMGYFTYAEGFRGGGFNGGARTSSPIATEPFKPEFINSYEIGFKSVGVERRMALNVAAFYAERKDQQVPQIITDESVFPPATDVLTRNAAESTTKGVEIELNGQPIEGLLIDSSMGYLDAKFNGFPGAQNAITGAPIDRAGEALPFVPKWQTHLGAQYSIEVPFPGPRWLQGWLTPRIDWTFVGRTVNWAPELFQLVQEPRQIVNFRLSYDFNDDRTQVAFLANNLADETYFIESTAIPRVTGVVTRYYEPPRWFAVEISQRF